MRGAQGQRNRRTDDKKRRKLTNVMGEMRRATLDILGLSDIDGRKWEILQVNGLG